MNEIVSILLPFFGLIALGYGAGRWRGTTPDGMAGLNFFVFYLALPALFFQLIAETPFEQLTSWSFILTTIFGTYCTFAIAFSIGALINRGNVPVSTIQGLVGAYSNSGYMAPGLTLAAFGAAAAAPTALIFTFENALLFALVPMMMALGSAERSNLRELLTRIGRGVFLHPFIIAIAAGFAAAAGGVSPPQAIDSLLTLLRSAAAPCALFAIGVGLGVRTPKHVGAELPVLIGIKLLVHPLVVYLLLSWIGGFDPIWVYTAVLMAALPPAANVFVLARQYRTYVAGASTAILLATLLSIFTVSTILSLILTGTLPTTRFSDRSAGAHAMSHDYASQRRQPVEEEQAEPADALNRDEIREKRAIQHIDRRSPRGHVGPPGRVERGELIGGARIGEGTGEQIGQRADVAVAEIEALGADRRKDVRGFACQRHPRAGEAPRRHPGERKHLPPAVDLDRAQDRGRARLDRGGEVSVGEDGAAPCLRRRADPDEARPPAGQRDQREGPGGRMELGRGVVVGPCVAEIDHQRRLIVAPFIDGYPGRGARGRAASVGSDDEPRFHGRAAGQLETSRFLFDVDGVCGRGAPVDVVLLDLRRERRDQRCIRDVVAEGVETDLGRFEEHLGRPDQPFGAVDDSQPLERCRRRFEARPYADPPEKRHRAGEQRRGALVLLRPRRADHRDSVPGLLEGEAGGQPDRPRAHDGDIGLDRTHRRLRMTVVRKIGADEGVVQGFDYNYL
jgi:malonate transporter and related proteins